MSEQEQKQQTTYDLLNAETRPKNSKITGVSLWPPSSPDLKSLDYAVWGILENKTNPTSYPNIGSLKTAIEEEWNKTSEKFILKAFRSFRSPVDTIMEKMAAISNKFTVLFGFFV